MDESCSYLGGGKRYRRSSSSVAAIAFLDTLPSTSSNQPVSSRSGSSVGGKKKKTNKVEDVKPVNSNDTLFHSKKKPLSRKKQSRAAKIRLSQGRNRHSTSSGTTASADTDIDSDDHSSDSAVNNNKVLLDRIASRKRSLPVVPDVTSRRTAKRYKSDTRVRTGQLSSSEAEDQEDQQQAQRSRNQQSAERRAGLRSSGSAVLATGLPPATRRRSLSTSSSSVTLSKTSNRSLASASPAAEPKEKRSSRIPVRIQQTSSGSSKVNATEPSVSASASKAAAESAGQGISKKSKGSSEAAGLRTGKVLKQSTDESIKRSSKASKPSGEGSTQPSRKGSLPDSVESLQQGSKKTEKTKSSAATRHKSGADRNDDQADSLKNTAPARTTGSCASSSRRRAAVAGGKQATGATSSNQATAATTSSAAASSSSLVASSSGLKPATNTAPTMSSGQDGSNRAPGVLGSVGGAGHVPDGQDGAVAAASDGASPSGAAAAAAAPTLSSFASLIPSLDPDSNDVGRLQALLEARGLPSHLFGALGPRMHQLLHRSMIGGSVGKAQQLLLNLQSKDEGQQLTAVIEMCQLLVMGNEDTLAGFPIKQVVPALITLLQMEHNFDMMHHACRALTYMMEALPRSSTVVVDAVPVLLEKLQAIQCMDVAEQSLQALEMLSKKHHKAILHANGVLACLTYVDFFSMPAQRAALSVTANCCQNVTTEEFHYIKESLPMLSARLAHNDRKSVDSVCLCMARLVDNYQTDSKILMDIASHGILASIQRLLVMSPSLISSNMFVTVVRMLVLMCTNCPDLAVQLLKQNIAETLCIMLVGPSTHGATQNIELVSRTPQELYEIVCLIVELMPKLPSDGLFAMDGMMCKTPSQPMDATIWQWLDDHGIWHSYSLIDGRIIEAAHQSGEHEVSLTIFGGNYTIDFDTMQQINDETGTARHIQRKTNTASHAPKPFLATSDSREEMLNEDSSLASAFINSLFCVLYEVYNSSAGPTVRHKCLQAILRMMYYASPELLNSVLPSCNVSSHVAAMMASHDLKIVISGIQMANILMEKLPEVFGVYFCREGVMHQIKKLCEPEAIDLTMKKESNSTAGTPTNRLTPPSTSGHSKTRAGPMLETSPGSSSGHSTRTKDPALLHELSTSSSVFGEPDRMDSTSPSSRLRLSSVLKHKKPPKKPTSSSGSRKSTRSELLASPPAMPSGSGASFEVQAGALGGAASPLTTPEPPTPGTSRGGDAVAVPPMMSRSGKWGSTVKTSFLAGLHPSRWGRSSSTGSDRPSPAMPLSVGSSHLLYQDSLRSPALPPRPSLVDNREKIKSWISEQAIKFCEKYYGSESGAVNNPALSSLNQLTAATAALADPVMMTFQQRELDSLKEIARTVHDSDMSPFEIIHSGLITALLTYLTISDVSLRDARLHLFLSVFLQSPTAATDTLPTSSSCLDISHPDMFASLVSKLMTCFHHLEQVKVHDLPGGATPGGRGSSALRFFDTHQLKCNLQRHSSCTTLKQWRGGSVKIDPLALVQAIERYLVMRGYGRVRPNADTDCSDDDDASDDDIDDTMAAVSITQGTGRHRIEFLIGDHVLPYNMTVYEAVKQYSRGLEAGSGGTETDTDSENPYGNTGIWINTHTIWFRKAPDEDRMSDGMGTSPKKTKADKSRRAPSRSSKGGMEEGDCRPMGLKTLEEFLTPSLPATVTVKDPSLEVLALLRLLHALNRHWSSLYETVGQSSTLLSEHEFLSSKLTAKANRQLQDPLIIMTGNMPQWLIQIGRVCPFLFPFDTRLSLFYATTFDRDRAMLRLQDASHDTAGPADSNERVAPRLERRKSIISREDILKQAEKLINDFGSSKAILEVQYENEVGTGLGPTLEFYALVSRELQRIDLDLWRGDPIRLQDPKEGDEDAVTYVYAPCGLFPSPIPRNAKAAQVNKVKAKFRFLGKFMAKALMDSRMLDLPLSQTFYKWMLGQELSLGPDDLRHINPVFAKSFAQLQQILREKKRIEADRSHTSDSRRLALDNLTMDGCSVEDLDLDFVLPGFANIELKKGGKDIPLTLDNLEEYLRLVTSWLLVEGTHRQFESLREGFESLFELSSLSLFYPEEMEQLFCGNAHETWTVKYLLESCRLDHGYTTDSQAIVFLFEILSSYSPDEQRMFVQFITGSPRLPVGGLKSLNPPLTIVRKTAEANENTDDFLPSVMTCVNYLKLPDYSSITVMREKLMLAAHEGQLSFHLS